MERDIPLARSNKAMRWVVSETNERMGTATYWAFYLVQEGERPAREAVRVSKGYWFVSAEGGDPAGKRLYDEGRAKAEAEAAKLNHQYVDCMSRSIANGVSVAWPDERGAKDDRSLLLAELEA